MNPLSLISLISGLLFLLGGLLLRVYPPKFTNPLYGYRTASSMRNEETWEKANFYAAKFMMLSGLILTCIGMFAIWLPPAPFTGMLAGLGLLILTVILLIYFTEKELKEHFDENGNRRA